MGGFYSAFVVFGRQDDDAGKAGAGFRGHGVARESEIRFNARAVLDNGLQAGVRIELEGETSRDQIDESYAWFDGQFGRLELGSPNGAAKSLWYGEPVPIGRHGLNDPTFTHVATGGHAIGVGDSLVSLASDRDKAAYFSPRIFGIQFGVSYTPDFTEELGTALRPDNNPGQQSEVLEVGANYVAVVRAVDVAAYVGAARADLEVAAPGMRDQRQWGAGFSLGHAGLVIGASFRRDNMGTTGSNTERDDFFAGIEYSTGPWRVAAQYEHSSAGAGAGMGEDVVEGVEIGGDYALGPGVILIGGVQWIDLRDNAGLAANENTALVGLLGVHLSF